VRKTFKYKLQPTAEQEGALAFVLRRCRELYTAGRTERRAAWQTCRASSTAASQRAHLPESKDVRPEYREVHSHVRPAVLPRRERALQAFFGRVTNGETPGYPRFHGAQRYNSFTYQQCGTGAPLPGLPWTRACWSSPRAVGAPCAGRGP
jgi:putative transposase